MKVCVLYFAQRLNHSRCGQVDCVCETTNANILCPKTEPYKIKIEYLYDIFAATIYTVKYKRTTMPLRRLYSFLSLFLSLSLARLFTTHNSVDVRTKFRISKLKCYTGPASGYARDIYVCVYCVYASRREGTHTPKVKLVSSFPLNLWLATV